MRLRLLATGTRQPEWVVTAYDEYARRLPPHCSLELIEIPTARRGKTADVQKNMEAEGERLLKAIPDGAYVVALDEHGQSVTTRILSNNLSDWLQVGRDVALLIGGPDGLAEGCLQRADWRWSLSPLTLPHGLVRVMVAEQLYRAHSLLQGHPYHRE